MEDHAHYLKFYENHISGQKFQQNSLNNYLKAKSTYIIFTFENLILLCFITIFNNK